MRVDGKHIKPTYVNFGHLYFTTVNVKQEGPYNVYVANNGQDFQRGSIGVVLNYYKLTGTQELSPTMIQLGNPTVVLTVYGYNFPIEATFYCVFGKPLLDKDEPLNNFNVVANVISDT